MAAIPYATDLLDRKASTEIRKREHCSRSCPAFKICPVMPLAVQAEDPKERICLISSSGSETIKRAYFNLFIGGQSGVIAEMQHTLLEYEMTVRGDTELTTAQKLRYLRNRMKMLLDLSKMIRLYGKIEDDNHCEDMVTIVPAGVVHP